LTLILPADGAGATIGSEWSHEELAMVFVFVLPPARHRHDHRSYSMILDRSFADNERVHDAVAHEDVSERWLEVIEAVEHERVITRGSWHGIWVNVQGERGSSASSNPVVLHDVALSEPSYRDPRAIRPEDCALGRRHGHVVIHDDSALHRPLCKLAKGNDAGNDALRLCPSAIDPVVRNQIRTGIDDANRLRRSCRHGPRRDHVPLDICSSDDTPEINRRLRRVPDRVSGNVDLHFCACYPHTEYQDPHGLVSSHSSSEVDIVIHDQERSGDFLRVSWVRWRRYGVASNNIDSVAAIPCAVDLAGDDHQPADRIHINRVVLRADKVQSLACDRPRPDRQRS